MCKQLILLSFADKRYEKALNRIRELTEEFPFTQCLFLNEDDLPKEYLKTLRYKTHRRGFGYWRWKSFLVRDMLEKMQDGDILVYSDAGVYWNKKGIKRFDEYIGMLKESENFILTFQQPYLEKDYSKGDILSYTGAYNDEDITMSFQLWGGLFILKKTSDAVSFVNKWYDLCHNHYNLITDRKSQSMNLPGFIENRHDQSAFSILVKQCPHVEISYKECQAVNRDWASLKEFPMQGRRDNNRLMSLKDKVIRKLSIPYKRMIGMYLKTFEHMHFAVAPNW